MSINYSNGFKRRRRKRKNLHRQLNSTILNQKRYFNFKETEKTRHNLYQLSPFTEGPNINPNVSKTLYSTAIRKGNELDWTNTYAHGGLAFGHVGPGNTVGKSSGPLDKAAQLHDIQYGDLGTGAYFHFNSADEHFIEDTDRINSNYSNLAGAFFKIKKLITTPLPEKKK